MPPKQALHKALTEKVRRRRTNRLAEYSPYAKQSAFHATGAVYRERLLRAGNQLGKTLAGSAEAAYHATGLYPEWWTGRRFDKPTTGWIGSPDIRAQRDGAQIKLLGQLEIAEEIGTGMLPQALMSNLSRLRNVADAADTVIVQHASGGASRMVFKTYQQGREPWQSGTVDWVWFDEEPPLSIYGEGLARITATAGLVWLTFTPLLGMSEVVRQFLIDPTPDRHDTNMTIEDAEHIPAEERERIIAAYPAHEREARARGIPVLGSGRIYPVAEAAISVPAFPIPDHWRTVGGLDFGWDHPFAAVKLAHDPDDDVLYVTNALRMREKTPVFHAAALKEWGDWFWWAWPQDGLQTSKDSGLPLADQYRRQGLRMMGQHAQHPIGGTAVEAGIMRLLDRMLTGRLKVFSHLAEWFEEFRLYHRKEGKVVKEADDLLDATRYAEMSLAYAQPHGPRREPVDRWAAKFDTVEAESDGWKVA